MKRSTFLSILAAVVILGPVASAQQRPSTEAVRRGALLVANQRSASASIIDLATGAVTHVEVGPGPHEAAISPDGRWGVVTVVRDPTARPPGCD